MTRDREALENDGRGDDYDASIRVSADYAWKKYRDLLFLRLVAFA